MCAKLFISRYIQNWYAPIIPDVFHEIFANCNSILYNPDMYKEEKNPRPLFKTDTILARTLSVICRSTLVFDNLTWPYTSLSNTSHASLTCLVTAKGHLLVQWSTHMKGCTMSAAWLFSPSSISRTTPVKRPFRSQWWPSAQKVYSKSWQGQISLHC